jgi:ABC-type branched-subunit amino acid transport system substrate-binding protein
MIGTTLGRREFVRAAARGCALVLAGGGAPQIWTPRPQETLRIGLVLPSPGGAAGSAAKGVTLGIEEAARTGGLFGRAIELRTAEGDAAADARRFAAEERLAAVIGGLGDASARALGLLADEAGILFFNVGSRSDALRGAECRRNAFHVEASEAMYADALAAHRSGEDSDDAAEAAEAVLWHPSLARFGAAQLIDRFRARFGGGMDAAAWAGWMAVKALWEASLRARTVDPNELRAYLVRESTRLDGHKGWPLSFRAWDRQLRQPLYLVSGDGARVVGEVPAARPAEGEVRSSADLLDRLGADASEAACRSSGGDV